MSMIATTQTDWPSTLAMNSKCTAYLDPLDEDLPTDEIVTTTRRAISRIALVAAETAGRFQREEVPYDPMTWMLAPRVLFNGASAVEACLDRDACLRGILIHGLSLGLDADPTLFDELASDEDADEAFPPLPGGRRPDSEPGASRRTVLPFPEGSTSGLRLFSATVVANDGFESVLAFHASIAADEIEVACRLQGRLGSAAVDAHIVEGFDPTDPLVAALVSDVMCDTLALISAEPSSPIAAGLDVNIEQRFHD